MPAVLDRKTGKVLRYLQGYRNGDCRVAAMGGLAFVGRTGAVDAATGREVGSRWAAAGKDAPKGFDPRRFDLFEAPGFPYMKQPGVSAWSALTPGVLYGAQQGTFYAYDLTRPARRSTTSRWRPHTEAVALGPARIVEARNRAGQGQAASDALIKAGDRLYGQAGKTLLAVELATEGGQPKLAWQHALGGTPSSIIAADASSSSPRRRAGSSASAATRPRRNLAP